jgi:phenylalanyl-tRNA synthetase alpha chain
MAMQNLDAVKTNWLEAVAAAASPAALEDERVKAHRQERRRSRLSRRGLGALSPDERREAGAKLNAVKDAVGRRHRGAKLISARRCRT